MQIVLRTYRAVIGTYDSNALVRFAVVTDSFTVRRPEKLNLAHFPACRVVIDDGSKSVRDIYTGSLFATVAGETLLMFVEENNAPFEQVKGVVMASPKPKMKERSAASAAYRIAAATANFGQLNLANLVKEAERKQVRAISRVTV